MAGPTENDQLLILLPPELGFADFRTFGKGIKNASFCPGALVFRVSFYGNGLVRLVRPSATEPDQVCLVSAATATDRLQPSAPVLHLLVTWFMRQLVWHFLASLTSAVLLSP